MPNINTNKYDSARRIDTIYFAGGCFWGTQRLMQLIPGVVFTEVGYANSSVPNPTYEQVCSGATGAAETVKVVYLPDKIDLSMLVRLFFISIHPTSVNQQGADTGVQYRTGIYYINEEDRAVAQAFIDSQRYRYTMPIAVEVKPLENFYVAEDYHQDYLINNPRGYCHIDPTLLRMVRGVRPKKYERPTDDKLQDFLTPMEYSVTQEGYTEPPFTNNLVNEFRPGLYTDITTGEPLFSSRDKFRTDTGWPAFSRPIDPNALTEHDDFSQGLIRTEVRSRIGDSHLGHVFHDGPDELGGRRYCINSAALNFIPRKYMEVMGYGEYLPYVD